MKRQPGRAVSTIIISATFSAVSTPATRPSASATTSAPALLTRIRDRAAESGSSGRAADGGEDHPQRADPEAPGHGDVVKFVQPHDEEHGKDECNRFNRGRWSSGEIVRNADQGEEDQEGDLKPDIGDRDPADGK